MPKIYEQLYQKQHPFKKDCIFKTKFLLMDFIANAFKARVSKTQFIFQNFYNITPENYSIYACPDSLCLKP